MLKDCGVPLIEGSQKIGVSSIRTSGLIVVIHGAVSGGAIPVAVPAVLRAEDTTVREPAADKPEQQFEFLGQTIYLQTGPAKLAQLTGAQVVPAAIEYNAQTQRHLLTLYPSIDPSTCTPEVLTQNALDCIGPHVMHAPEQQFYDLLGALQTPQILQKAQ